jgi:hypothetical protein
LVGALTLTIGIVGVGVREAVDVILGCGVLVAIRAVAIGVVEASGLAEA